MTRVLVTGGTGFIGRHALPLLVKAGHEVHAVSTTSHESSVTDELQVPRFARDDSGAGRENNIQWHVADLLEKGEGARVVGEVKPEKLLHLAWYAEPGNYWTSPLNYRWVSASLDLARAFHEHGGRRMVCAGTVAEYDWTALGDGICREESTSLRPVTLYGMCKHSLRMMLEPYAKLSKFEVAWGRIFYLYGPQEHESRVVASVIKSLLAGEDAKTTHGRQVRDVLHVADVASAFVALVESNVTGAVNIGSGEPVELRDLLRRIADRIGAGDHLKLGALEARAGEPQTLVAHVGRLRNEVQWHPSMTLDAGLDATVDWWRQKTS